MKRKRFLITGLILGTLLGWTLGFLRLPYLEKNNSFWVGFTTCLTLLLFLFALVLAWQKNVHLLRFFQSHNHTPTSNHSRTYRLLWLLIALFILSGGLLSAFLIQRQNNLLVDHNRQQDQRLEEQAELIASIRQSNQVFLMNNILDNVEAELKQHPEAPLSDAVVARLAALSYSLKPYRYLINGRLSEKKWSPERGQLLVALSLMQIDSLSFAKIKQAVSFAQADLQGADLPHSDLSGIHLQAANLKAANLSGANLKAAILIDANLSEAILDSANFHTAKLIRANLSWAEMNKANLSKANLDGANMSNAILRKADFQAALFQYGKLDGALLIQANLSQVSFLRASLVKANLTDANLNGSNIRLTDLSEADLTGASLARTCIDEPNWLENLTQKQVTGKEAIQSNYTIVEDTSYQWPKVKYRLIKKGL